MGLTEDQEEFDLVKTIRICLERRIPVRVQYGPKVAERREGLVARYSDGTISMRDLMGDFHTIDLADIVKFEVQ